MPTIDATGLSQTLNMLSAGTADFANISATFGPLSSRYVFDSTAGWEIWLNGTGISVDISNIPISGTITSVSFYTGPTDGSIDLNITGLSFDITDLSFTSGAAANDTFWQTVLAGETTYLPGPGAFEGRFLGDQHELTGGTLFASDDTLVGADADNTYLYGDVEEVTGGFLIGGNDILNGTFDQAFGDASVVYSGAQVVGGNDQIIFQSNWTGDGSASAFADVFSVIYGGTVIGGDDLIDARVLSGQASPNYLIGDAHAVAGLASGGQDTIYGSAGQDYIFGDAEVVTSTGVLISGDDVLFGMGGDDSIYGDVDEEDGTVLSGGNDYIDGGIGNDSLFGNAGNDTILGGADSDLIEGGAGVDKLQGGKGRDTMRGGEDDDRLIGGKGRDRLEGDEGNDLLEGNLGNDNIFGNAGNDTLIGGDGNDNLTGGNNADTFVFEDGFGNDTINDFAATNNNEDIDLSGVAAITDYADLLANHIDDSSGTVIIDDGAGNTITLNGITSVGQLDAGNFMF